MADRKTKSQDQAGKQAVPVNQEPTRYPKVRLIQNAREVFGVAPEVVVGALHDKPGDAFTKAEVGRYVDAFLRRQPE